MIRTLIWYVYFALGLLRHLPKIKKHEKQKGMVSDFEYFSIGNEVARTWSNQYIKLAGLDVEVIGKENIIKDRPVLFVSNHQSNLDTAIFQNYLDDVPVAFIAKKELSNWPILARMMTNSNCLFIDRHDIRKTAETMLQAMEYVKQGFSVFVYPEGTRGDGPEIADFPSTAIKIATKTKVPICPITISGTYNAMEGNKGIIKPAKVRVFIHPPIETKDLSKEELKNIHKDVTEIVKSELVLDLNHK